MTGQVGDCSNLLPMNILFPNSILDKHVYALHLANAYDLSKKNEKTVIIRCNGFLKACEVNVVGSKLRCRICTKRVDFLAKSVNVDVIDLNDISIFKKDTKFGSNQSKDGVKVGEVLGVSAAGTIASYERVSDLNRLSEFGKSKYKILREESKKLYNTISDLQNFLTVEKNNLYEMVGSPKINVYVFNGRYVTALPFFLFADNKKEVNFYATELWGQKNPIISKNRIIHDPSYIYESCLKAYSILNESESEFLAQQYYKSRWSQKGNNNGEKNFTKKQKKTNKNIFCKNVKIKISMFPSSGYEYNFLPYGYDPVIQDFESKCFLDRLSKSKEQIEVIIRLHPNLSNATELEYNSFQELSKKTGKNLSVRVINPTDVISTYQLMRESDYVISFASFASVEANYLEKKTLQIGPSRYRYFNISNQYKDGYKAAQAILQDKVDYKSKLGSIVFACGFMSRTDFMKSYIFNGKMLTANKIKIKTSLLEKIVLYISSYDFFLCRFSSYILHKVNNDFK